MPNYVESATLFVIDKSSKKLGVINKAVRQLDKSAKQLDKRMVRLRIENPDHARIAGDLRELQHLKTNLATRTGLVFGGNLQKVTTDARALRKVIMSIPRTRTTKVGITFRKGDESRLKNLNGQLDRLSRRKAAMFEVKPVGLTTALKMVQKLITELDRLNGRTAKPKVNPQGVSGGGGGARGSGSGENEKSATKAFAKEMTVPKTAARVARGIQYGAGGDVYQAARATTRTALVAPLTTEQAEQRLKLAGFEEETQNLIKGYARQLSKEYQAVPTAEIIDASVEVAGNLEGDPEAIKMAMERVAENAQKLAAILQTDARDAANQARMLEKIIGMRGLTTDPEAANAFSDTVLRGVIASGGDLSIGDAVRMMQQLGALRGDIGTASMLQVLNMRDESGRMGTAEMRMAFEELFRGSLNKSDMAAQKEVGFRDADGSSSAALNLLADDMLAFTAQEVIPRLQEANVDLTSVGDVSSFIDQQLGFTTSASRLLAQAAMQYEERMKSYERSLAANPDVAITDPTTRQEASAVRAQFENVASEAIKPLLPAVKVGLDGLSDSLAVIASGAATPADYITAGVAAAPVGLYAAVDAMMDPATRPMAASALALTSSATSLSGAAGALTIAAGVLGAGGLVKGAGGAVAGAAGAAAGGAKRPFGVRLARHLTGLSALAGLFAVAKTATKAGAVSVLAGGGGSRIPEPVQRAAKGEITVEEAHILLKQGSVEDRTPPNAAAVNAWFDTLLGRTDIHPLAPKAAPLAPSEEAVDVAMDLQAVMAEMADMRNRNLPVEDLAAERNELVAELDAMGISGNAVAEAFSLGTTDVQTALTTGAAEIAQAGVDAGSSMAQQLLSIGPELGNMVGQAVKGAVANLKVNVNAAPQGNTGTAKQE